MSRLWFMITLFDRKSKYKKYSWHKACTVLSLKHLWRYAISWIGDLIKEKSYVFVRISCMYCLFHCMYKIYCLSNDDNDLCHYLMMHLQRHFCQRTAIKTCYWKWYIEPVCNNISYLFHKEKNPFWNISKFVLCLFLFTFLSIICETFSDIY